MQPDPAYITLTLPDGMPPVSCAVRRSPRAKRFFLRVSPHPFAVQLVLPPRRSLAAAKRFAEGKTAWLAATIRRLAPEPGVMPLGPCAPRRIPSGLDLRLTGEHLEIALEEPLDGDDAVGAWYDPLFGRITLKGASGDTEALAEALLGILTKLAAPVLSERLRGHASALGFGGFRILVHPQRSRWGSCSATGKVTLNTLLMLFPPEVVDYVMLHELCHKFEMNHSERFRARMDSLCPEWRERDAMLRKCAKEIPDVLL